MTTNPNKLWDEACLELLNKIRLSCDEIADGEEIATCMFEELWNNLKPYRVRAAAVVGDVAKRTAIRLPNNKLAIQFDLIVLISQYDIAVEASVIDVFFDIRQQIVNVLSRISKFDIFMSVASSSCNRMCLKVKNTIFNLNIGILFSYDCRKQTQNALHNMRNLTSDLLYLFEPCILEASVGFVRQQSDHVLQIVRLAKFWLANVDFGSDLVDLSALIETLAIKAGKEIESHGQTDNNDNSLSHSIGGPDCVAIKIDLEPKSNKASSVFKGFRQFLDTVINLRNLKFVDETNYNKSVVKSEIFSQVPLVLDPVNPYRNLALVSEEVTETLIGHAKESVRLIGLNDCARNRYTDLLVVCHAISQDSLTSSETSFTEN